MPELDMYQVDAFAGNLFEGNPAAVIPLAQWLPDATMQKIAMENNLSETAFFTTKSAGVYELRWFTPTKEVDLCGHATLATAYVIFRQETALAAVRFDTRSGELIVNRSGDEMTMNFPSDAPKKISDAALDQVEEALGLSIKSLHKGNTDFLAVLESENLVQNIQPDFDKVAQLDARGIIVSAISDQDEVDFVSRCFYPAYGIKEDPFTGSAHCVLGCYWSAQLGKTNLRAKQLSKRTGKATLELKGDRIDIKGKAVLFLEGKVYLPENV